MAQRDIRRLKEENQLLRSHHSQCHPNCKAPREPSAPTQQEEPPLQLKLVPSTAKSSPPRPQQPRWQWFADDIIDRLKTNLNQWAAYRDDTTGVNHLSRVTVVDGGKTTPSEVGTCASSGLLTYPHRDSVPDEVTRLQLHSQTFQQQWCSHQRWRAESLAVQIVGLCACAETYEQHKATVQDVMKRYQAPAGRNAPQSERYLVGVCSAMRWICTLVKCIERSGWGQATFAILFIPREFVLRCRVERKEPLTSGQGRNMGLSQLIKFHRSNQTQALIMLQHIETRTKELAGSRQTDLRQVARRGLRSLHGHVSDLLGRGQVGDQEFDPALQMTGAAGDASSRIKRMRIETSGGNCVQLTTLVDQDPVFEAVDYGHMSPGASTTAHNSQDVTDFLRAELRTQQLIF